MLPSDTVPHGPDEFQRQPSIQCDACEAALTANESTLSFLLLDQLRVPLLGCDDHREQFTDVCGLTTEDSPDLLSHQPAGGISCPGCHLAPHNPQQPLLPVQDGAVAVLACPDHHAETVARFQAGLDIQEQLTATLDTSH